MFKINHIIPFPFVLPFVFFPFTGERPSKSICFCEDFSLEAFLDGDFPSLSTTNPSPHSPSPGDWDIWCCKVCTWSIWSSLFGLWSRHDSESDDSVQIEWIVSYAKTFDFGIISNHRISNRQNTYLLYKVQKRKLDENSWCIRVWQSTEMCFFFLNLWIPPNNKSSDGTALTLCSISLSMFDSFAMFISSLFPGS